LGYPDEGRLTRQGFGDCSAHRKLSREGRRDQAPGRRRGRHGAVEADEGFPCYPLFLKDAQLDPIRRDPRFVALLDKLERDWEERGKSLDR